MASKAVQAGEIFIKAGQPLDNFWYITEGSVQGIFPGGFVTLKRGDIIGICDFDQDSHFLSYKATTDSKIIPYGSPAVFVRTNFFAEHPDNMMHLAQAMNRFVQELVRKYGAIYSGRKALHAFL